MNWVVNPQLYFWGNLRSIQACSWKELGISILTLGISTFPVLRDTGENNHLPKTGLNSSPPVVLPLENSDCHITKPPLTDHFPEMFSLYFPVSHSPPGPVLFICITSVWGRIQKIKTLTSSFRRWWKGLFCLGEGLFVPAWNHGIIIIMGLNWWWIKLVVAGRYNSMAFLESEVKFGMNGTIYIPCMCWLCHFSVLFSLHSWILRSFISLIWTRAGLALSQLPKPAMTFQGDLYTCTTLDDSLLWERLHALSQPQNCQRWVNNGFLNYFSQLSWWPGQRNYIALRSPRRKVWSWVSYSDVNPVFLSNPNETVYANVETDPYASLSVAFF